MTGIKAGMAAFKAAGGAMKGAKALGSLAKANLVKGMSALKGAFTSIKNVATKIKDFVKAPFKCNDPVDTRNGSVTVEEQDFEIPGRLPLSWERYYSGTSNLIGACGYGWETLADLRLELHEDGSVVFSGPGLGGLFPSLPSQIDDYVLDRFDGARLFGDDMHWTVLTKDGLRYIFPILPFDTETLDSELLQSGVLSLVERIEDTSGNSWQFERSEGLLTRIVESGPVGRVIEVETSLEGYIESMTLTDPTSGESHRLVTYQYEQDDLVATIDPLGVADGFEYAEHRIVRHTDRLGLSFRYEYDDQWRVVHAWGDGGLYDYRFTYDEANLQTQYIDSLGHTITITHNENLLPVSVVDKLGAETVYEYDPDSWRTVSVIAPGDLRTSYAHDSHGNLLSTMLPDGSTLQTAYDDDDLPVAVTDPEGGVWRQEWDARRNLTRQIAPNGASTCYEYTEQGDLLSVTDPTGQSTRLEYDRWGFLGGLTDALGLRTALIHDIFGNLTQQELANGDTTQHWYDARGRLVESLKPDAARVQYSYDPEDNLTAYRDEAGRETQFTYYCRDSIQSRTDPDGSRVEYHYNTEEQLVGVSNQKGQRWHLKRDPVGRLTEEIDYWGQSRRYEYDPAGHLIRHTDPLGQVIAVTCDKLGRVVERKALGQDAETYHYDRLGQILEARNQFGTVRRQYDKNRQLTQEVQEQSDVEVRIDYSYDLAGQLLEQTQQFNHQQGGHFEHTRRCTYNALGQPDRVQVDDHEPVGFTYDAVDRLTGQQISDHQTYRNTFNAAGRLSNQSSAHQGQPLTEIDYDYDDAGNLMRRNDHRLGVDQYRYDLLGQVIAQTDPAGKVSQFVHDGTGDRFKTSLDDEPGRTMHHDDGSTWSLDNAGQLVRKRDARGTQTVLKWDGFGRLRTLSVDQDSSEFEYAYDPFGRRIRKTKTDLQSADTVEITWFIWDEDTMVGEVRQATGESLHAQFYDYHQNSFVPLAMQTQTLGEDGVKRSLYLYQNDPNGMPLRLLDLGGAIVWEAHYAAHGKIDRLGAVLIQPLRLQGQYFDDESGLHYNRHRYYDAVVGFYISIDPLGLEGGLNPYQLGLNVFAWIDPLGLVCVGALGEALTKRALTKAGFQVLPDIKNASGHGIDIVARGPNGALHFFEVKATRGLRFPRLSAAQAKGAQSFVTSRLKQAVGGLGHWAPANVAPGTAARAAQYLNEIGAAGGTVSGYVVKLRLGIIGPRMPRVSVTPW
jgi:RHS repeat-associated protein